MKSNPLPALTEVRSLQNPTGAPINNLGFSNLNWPLNEAKKWYGVIDPALAYAVREHAGPVLEEIGQFRRMRAIDPVQLARRCFLFSILSPQSNFEETVIAANQVYELLASNEWEANVPAWEIELALEVPFHGEAYGGPKLINFGNEKAKYVSEALPFLRELEVGPKAFTYERIHNQRGMGEKTTAMALALFDDTSPVFTLDQWMFRLTIAMGGGDSRVKVRATMAGYKLTEGDWLAWSRVNLPNLSPFAVQWTVWDLIFGEHKNHLGILGR